METEPRPWDRHFLIAAQIILANEITDDNIVKSIAILGYNNNPFFKT